MIIKKKKKMVDCNQQPMSGLGKLAAGTKILEISAIYRRNFVFSVLVEKKFRWKNRLKKNRGKIAKNRRFLEKNRKNSIFSRKNQIFPEIWGKL